MRKYLFYIFVCLMSVGVLAACKTRKVVEATVSDLDGEWVVVEMNGRPLAAGENQPVMRLDILRRGLSGNAGCNRLMGQIEYDSDHRNIIRFLQVATTRMACPDMSVERAFLEALDKVARFEAVGEEAPVRRIALFGTKGEKLLELTKR
ncbi:MAG TPA: META domain-containing protein [Candidatus Parabacteroides intestinigallinarum]|uniref:META domain-containing protein n=1 Tax=Candidatus Parabacteroides intestinigallinarum TaxID=2838722 RepID=A0A9D1XPX2_9BACT|nr:META domain-containing protein [Candidatus Parabacteroides intestinigallinarum]